VDQSMLSLEESALHNIEDFGHQELANTLQAMAKKYYSPTRPLVIEALELQVETLAGRTFKTCCGVCEDGAGAC
jgi:hypothetical protein